MDLKTIGSSMTVGEFNAYVSLLRGNIYFAEQISMNPSNVIGKYAVYGFNFNDATIVDKGILITDETKSAENSIEIFPIFTHSSYHLTFTLMSIEDYNLFVEDSNDYIETETFEIVLSNDENSRVLDFSEYENNMVLLFDVGVKILHDIPKIVEV